MAANRFKVTQVNGEQFTIFYIVDTDADESEQPAIVAQYSTGFYGSKARTFANRCRDAYNRMNPQ